MTKTYELSNEKMIMADVDEEHHTATISVYALDDLVKEANKADALEQIRDEIRQTVDEEQKHDGKWAIGLRYALKIIDTYMKGE